MNKNFKFLVLICFAVFCILSLKAQKTQKEQLNFTDTLGRKQGHWIKYDGNKKKVYDGNFVNDIPVGKFIYYSGNNTPWAITVFSQQGKVGYTKHLSAGGKISAEGKYINQQKDSLWKFYDGTGVLKAEENYLNGIKHGKSKVYYDSGKLAEEKNWSNDLLDGTYTKYFENGNIKSQRELVKGKVEGKARFNHPSGKVYAEGPYKNDMKQGVWTFYEENGNVQKKVTYIKGLAKNGEDQVTMTKEEEERIKKQYENSEYNDAKVQPR